MKRLLIFFILLTIFLSGCGSGLYNLNLFTIPDDIEFFILIQELDTPRKICQYMQNNFEYEPHPYMLLTPHQLYMSKKGDCNDFATFATFIADYHGYKTFLVKIYYKNYAVNHYLAIYKENDLYNFSDTQYYFSVNYDNFYDIVKFDGQQIYEYYGYIWSRYIIYDYNMNVIEQVTK